MLALAVGTGIGIDTLAPSQLTGHMLAREVSQALAAQRTAVVETECIAAGDTIEVKKIVFHHFLLSFLFFGLNNSFFFMLKSSDL